MTIYESITNKSKLEGKFEGKIEGKHEGKLEVILSGYENGLSIPLLANITGFSEYIVVLVLKEQQKIK